MIRITLPENHAEHVAFAYSPLLECVLSLHVFVGPKHHALHHSWVRGMRNLDAGIKRRIDTFRFVYETHLPDMLVPRPFASPKTFEEELEQVCSHPPDLLVEEFGRPLFDHGGRHGQRLFDDPEVRQTVLSRAAATGQSSLRAAKLLLDDPQQFAREFVDFVVEYWESAFGAEWERVDRVLSDSVAESDVRLGGLGILAVLGRLPSHYRPDPDRRVLEIDLPHEHSVCVSAQNPLVLSPSVFAWPHVFVNCDAPWPTSLVYAAPALARDAAARIPPAELTLILRALADDTRLRILKLIAERPRTTQEVASLVGLSMSGASKSIQKLAEAGLISSRREGYYVVYRISPRRVATLAGALAEFFEREG
jgi:DNA-binding transcriptional ArsR family regulator